MYFPSANEILKFVNFVWPSKFSSSFFFSLSEIIISCWLWLDDNKEVFSWHCIMFDLDKMECTLKKDKYMYWNYVTSFYQIQSISVEYKSFTSQKA